MNVNQPLLRGGRRDDEDGDASEPSDWEDIAEGTDCGDEKADTEHTGSNEDKDLFADKPTDDHSEKFQSETFKCQPCDNVRIPRRLNAPIKPSAEDVDAHMCTHLPYRSWCPICVETKGKEDGHFRDSTFEEDKSGLPIISFDYQTLSEDTKEEQKLIIGNDESAGNVLAHYVLCKGLGAIG